MLSRRRGEPVSVTEARHEAGTTLPLHAHPAASAVLVIAGTFEETVDGRSFSCGPGSVLLRPPGAAHADRFGGEGAEYVVVQIPRWTLFGFDGRSRALSRIRHFRDSTRAPMEELWRSVREPAAERDEIEELLLELLGSVASDPEGRKDDRGNYGPPAWLRGVYDRVRRDFRTRPPIAELAADAGVHPDYVCRSFSRHFGFTISDLVRHCRVLHAARLIRDTDRPLSSVAYHGGFSDQSHMTRQMKRHLGLTPGEFRRATSARLSEHQDRSRRRR